MKMKKIPRYLNLFCGQGKGFVLTFDAFVAVFIAVLAIAASSIYVNFSAGDQMAKLQMSRNGYDLLNIISNKNIWQYSNEIQSLMGSLLPSNYAMIIKEKCGSSWSDLAKANTESFDLPSKKEITAGEKVVLKGGAYCIERFYIWLK